MGRGPCARMGAAEGSAAETRAAPAGSAGWLPAGPAFPPGARARTGRQEAWSRSHAAGGGCGGGGGDGSVPCAHVAREGEHPRRPDGRPRARGGGGPWARSASARKDRGPLEARDDRRPPPVRDRERSALRAVAEGTSRAAGGGRRARAALDARADAEPSRGERTAGSEETRPALRAVARRGPDVRVRGEGSGRAKRPCRPCRPTPNGRAMEREPALRAVRAEACGREAASGVLMLFHPRCRRFSIFV